MDVVKNLQRTDPGAREQWVAYVAQCGEKACDPSKHPDSFLRQFVTQYNAGYRIEPPAQRGVEEITELIKTGQKRSSNWRALWSQYCQMQGTGLLDPSKHEAAFQLSFIDFISERACLAMSLGQAQDFAGTQTLEPPVKRTKVQAHESWPVAPSIGEVAESWNMGAATGEEVREQVIQEIKSLQKNSLMEKQRWSWFCDSMLGGVKDPARHDLATLHMFLSEVGANATTLAVKPTFGTACPEKAQLVQRVKDYQRQGEEQKHNWSSFCDEGYCGVKDPCRHEVVVLRHFVNSYGVP